MIFLVLRNLWIESCFCLTLVGSELSVSISGEFAQTAACRI